MMTPLWGRHEMFDPCRLCCKSLLSIWARNIDSRSSANTQQRFKRTGAPIRLFQISIAQSPLGDFCNTIPPKADVDARRLVVDFAGSADGPPINSHKLLLSMAKLL